MIQQRIEQLRALMKQNGITAYLVGSNDFHLSEYVCDYFKGRQYLSGFTGSAGVLVVTADVAGLWTDGRYFLQAEQELAQTPIQLFRSGEKDVPTIECFLEQTLQPKDVLAFDGRTISQQQAQQLHKKLDPCGIQFRTDIDLLDTIWKDRPSLPANPTFCLSEEYTGQRAQDKILKIRQSMAQSNAQIYLITALDEIAWLLNIRGADIAYTPVVLAYCIVTAKQVFLFSNPQNYSEAVLAQLQKYGAHLRDYDQIYPYLKTIKNQKILVDLKSANCAIIEAVQVQNSIIDQNLIEKDKAIKNPTECDQIRKAHLKDGIACTCFIHWLKTHVASEKITEISAAEKLDSFRKAQPDYLYQSFAPILAYGPHGAIVHYEASAQSNAMLRPENFLLVDTGGHYLQGTTDITRTIALGPLTEQQKQDYTYVLKANLALTAAVFKQKTTGKMLDCLAREELWRQGLDYNHGTGHGVGYLLNVHESGVGFGAQTVFEPGMLTSDEPGLYRNGQYGIRLENLMLCQEDRTTSFGDFLHFETVTLCPFEREAILPNLLSPQEKSTLNEYHDRVYQTLSTYLDKPAAQWLKQQTQEI